MKSKPKKEQSDIQKAMAIAQKQLVVRAASIASSDSQQSGPRHPSVFTAPLASGTTAQGTLQAQLNDQFSGGPAPMNSRNADIRIIEGAESHRHPTVERKRRPPAPAKNRRLLQDLGPAHLELGPQAKERRAASKELFDAAKLYGNYLSDSIENSSLEGSFREHFKMR